MTIHLSEATRRFMAEQVAQGRYPSEDALLEDAVDRMRRQGAEGPPDPEATPPDPVIGLFRDDADLLDEIIDEAMRAREERPWRTPAGE